LQFPALLIKEPTVGRGHNALIVHLVVVVVVDDDDVVGLWVCQ
jgi:hypothetical protein